MADLQESSIPQYINHIINNEMKKSYLILACTLIIVACSDNSETNDLDTSQVGFKISLNEMEWSEGDAIGIISICNRGDKTSEGMSKNSPARFLASVAGSEVSFVAATEDDKVLSQKGDHSFKFYAAYPFPEDADNFTSISAAADSNQTYSANPLANMTMIGSASALNVIAPVIIPMETPFALIKLQIPKDIIPGEQSTLKSVTLVGKNTFISKYGGYNVVNREFTLEDSTNHVTLNFPSGLVLEEKNTPIYLVVAPFTVPEGGLMLNVETINGSKNSIPIWESDSGKEIAAGTVTEWTKVINPVTFPVVFPLGYKTYNEEEGPVGTFAADADGVYRRQPYWNTIQRWIAEQPSAYAQWHNVHVIENEVFHTTYQNVNSGGKISSPGICGIWTGDYFEFVLPVVGFKAGTTINLNFPTYGRQHPMFWDIEYLDGGEWKCNRTLLTSDVPAHDETGLHPEMEGKLIECEATFMSNRGNNTHSIDITFDNAIDEGYLKIRLVSNHAEYQNGGRSSSDAKRDYIRSTPWVEGGSKYGSVFYFYCRDNKNTPDIDESKMDFVISEVKK